MISINDIVLTRLSTNGKVKRIAKLIGLGFGSLLLVPGIVFFATGLYKKAFKWMVELKKGLAIHRKINVVQEKNISNGSKPAQQKSVKELIEEARKASTHLVVDKWKIPSPKKFEERMEEIKQNLQKWDIEDLEKLFVPYQSAISKICSKWKKQFSNLAINSMGRDSAIRLFLTDNETSLYLRQDKMITAIIALSIAG